MHALQSYYVLRGHIEKPYPCILSAGHAVLFGASGVLTRFTRKTTYFNDQATQESMRHRKSHNENCFLEFFDICMCAIFCFQGFLRRLNSCNIRIISKFNVKTVPRYLAVSVNFSVAFSSVIVGEYLPGLIKPHSSFNTGHNFHSASFTALSVLRNFTRDSV